MMRFVYFKQKTAYEMRSSDWSSDVCSSDLKQLLLETLEVGARLELLIGFVDGEIDVQQLEKRIRGRVKSQMEKSQREYYLNEQMKAIQKELGEDEIGRAHV